MARKISALVWETRGRRFKSSRSDHFFEVVTSTWRTSLGFQFRQFTSWFTILCPVRSPAEARKRPVACQESACRIDFFSLSGHRLVRVGGHFLIASFVLT